MRLIEGLDESTSHVFADMLFRTFNCTVFRWETRDAEGRPVGQFEIHTDASPEVIGEIWTILEEVK